MRYYTVATAEIKTDVYAGDPCGSEHKPYIESQCVGDMDCEVLESWTFDTKRWPVGTILTVRIPECPQCTLDAEFQDKHGKCECGFDWKVWAEEEYS